MGKHRENLTKELMHGKHLAEQLISTHHDPSSSTQDTLLLLDNILASYGGALSRLGSQRRAPKQITKAKVAYESPHNDGYSWRKYGQKNILGSQYPREYYRCKYKAGGCSAHKQVQRSDSDSTLMEVTYSGTHTCRSQANASYDFIFDQMKEKSAVFGEASYDFIFDQMKEKSAVFGEASSNFSSPTTSDYNALQWKLCNNIDPCNVGSDLDLDVYSNYSFRNLPADAWEENWFVDYE